MEGGGDMAVRGCMRLMLHVKMASERRLNGVQTMFAGKQRQAGTAVNG